MPVSVRYSTAAELVCGVAAAYLALAALRRLLLTHERGSGAEWHDGSREPSVSVRHDVSREPRVGLRKLKRQPSERHHDNSDSDMDDEPESPSQTAYRPVPKSTCATVLLFGADGNLASTRVLPTLHLLWQRELLPPDLLIVGFARPVGGGGTIVDTAAFREYVGRCCGGSPAAFLQRCHYATGQFDDRAAVGRCLQQVAGLEAERAAGRAGGPAAEGCVRMYYAAVPAFIYAPLTRALCENGVGAADGALKERFVFEKPFGHDTASCEALVADLARLPGRDVFWMDHYLGKELVMNLLILRFANICFGSLWNRHAVKAVQVIFKEERGIEGRGGYFDQYGIIRDVMQNHLLQMMALVAMEQPLTLSAEHIRTEKLKEQPLSLSAEHIRTEKLKVLQAIAPLAADDVVLGQYSRSQVGCGYLEEPSVRNKASCTETFAAAVLHIDNPRWAGVPFVLKAAQAVTENKVELRIQFHGVPGAVATLRSCEANELVVRVQPEEAIYWKVQSKVPGLRSDQVEQVRMDLLYSRLARKLERKLPQAYERLLLEVIANDHSHFVSPEEQLEAWRIFTPALHHLRDAKLPPHRYPVGSRGPAAADQLAKRYGMRKFGGGLTPYVMPFKPSHTPGVVPASRWS